jgi:peptidyl-prolyl cis-trans isomerase A (cyclophilin A)|tara:strand:+ start:2911 stop:4086 length:1176 start_codon:yes stop_codon:yes gene_type:complete
MKFTKQLIKTVALMLLISATACKQKYPELGEGLFAEFITTKDTIVVQLFYNKTPLTVSNFVGLSEGTHPMLADSLKGKPYYNGTVFHRVINNFMIQGGDPTATGSGSPGFKFGDEFDSSLNHDKAGTLSMANSGPATNGSQFFITDAPTPHLDNKHSVFGEVVMGLEVVDAISNVEVTPGSNKPLEDVIILELNIIRQGMAAIQFDAADVWTTELPLLEEKRLKKIEATKLKAAKKKKIADEKAAITAKEMVLILDAYKSKATSLTSGLLIHTISKGEGLKPRNGSTVKLNYEGYFTNGNLFGTNVKSVDKKYGSYDQRKEAQGAYNPISMPIDPEAQMIPGFKQGVLNMLLGDKTFLYLPSYIAYGEKGKGPIEPNTDLIFIVEMVEIIN